jgi:hypothetical protein
MTQHPYQLNSILFGQLHEGLMAVPDQFWGDTLVAKSFNCSLTIWENIDVFISIVLSRLSAMHALMAYSSTWNTVVYYARLRLVPVICLKACMCQTVDFWYLNLYSWSDQWSFDVFFVITCHKMWFYVLAFTQRSETAALGVFPYC